MTSTRVALPADARQVVGKGRPGVAAELDDLGLGEGRVQRVGGVQQLDHGAGGDAAPLVALDHGGADHEQVLAAGDDVEREARMEQPHRAG